MLAKKKYKKGRIFKLCDSDSNSIENDLTKCLDDEDLEVRNYTKWAIHILHSNSPKESLISCLSSEDPIVRRYAVKALIEIDPDSSADALMRCFGKKDLEFLGCSTEALKALYSDNKSNVLFNKVNNNLGKSDESQNQSPMIVEVEDPLTTMNWIQEINASGNWSKGHVPTFKEVDEILAKATRKTIKDI